MKQGCVDGEVGLAWHTEGAQCLGTVLGFWSIGTQVTESIETFPQPLALGC